MTSKLDSFMRHQVYLEGFKAGSIRLFNDGYLPLLDNDLRKLMVVQKVEHLNDLTKAQINALIARLIGLLQKTFNKYASALLRYLRKFMAVERTLMGQVLGEPSDPSLASPRFGPLASADTGAGRDRLWTTIEYAPLPGVGIYMLDAVASLGTVATAKITAAVRASVANGLTPAEAMEVLVGDPTSQFGNSMLTKFQFQNATIVRTLIEHISTMVVAAVASAEVEGYTWASVLDGGTTAICVERNGIYYLFADGPLPPAHYGCRSFIIPGHAVVPNSFAAWLTTQPVELVYDMLSTRDAEQSLRMPTPLSLDEYIGKLDNIAVL